MFHPDLFPGFEAILIFAPPFVHSRGETGMTLVGLPLELEPLVQTPVA